MKYQDLSRRELLGFLGDNYNSVQDAEVKIKGVINIETAADFTIQSTYRDIFLIINMLDDYAAVLKQSGRENSAYAGYMIGQFERISKELAEQIALDKEKMLKRCRKRSEKLEDIGEEAMVLGAKIRRMG